MDDEARLWAVVIVVFIAVMGGLTGAVIYANHVEEMACIKNGGQVVVGNCLSKPTP